MKHNLKRLLSLVLALAMCLSMVWVPAFAEEGVITDAELNGKCTLGIAGSTQKNTEVTICEGQSTVSFSVYNKVGAIKYNLNSVDKGNAPVEVVTDGDNVTVSVNADAATGNYKIEFKGTLSSKCYLTVKVSDHDYAYTTIEEATCVDEGSEKGVCNRCNKVTTRTVDAKGHEWGEYAAVEGHAATCTEDGLEGRTCTVCGVADENQVIPAFGHEWGEYVPADAATCVKNATEIAQCIRNCGAADTREIPDTAAGVHVYGDWYTVEEASEESKGKERRDCINCEAYQERYLRHTKGDFLKEEVITEANCSFAGSKEMTYACADEDCEFQIVETVEIPKNDVHLGEPVTTYENINLKEGFYDEVTTYSECHHTVTKPIELDKLEPQVYEKAVKPGPARNPGTIDVPLHAGQEADFKVIATGAGDFFNVPYKVEYDEKVITLYQDGKVVKNKDTFTFKSSEDDATPFVIVANHVMENDAKKTTTIEISYFYSCHINVTVDPHVETPVIANTHPATCTEPGELTLDTFCKFCGYQISSEDKEITTEPLGHLMGNPKWDWVLTRDAEEWAVTAKQICGRENCDYSEDMDVNLDIDSSGNFKVYTATVTDAKGTTYKAVKTQELTYKYSYNGTTVDCYYGQKVVLTADTKSDWFVNGEKVAAGTASYSFRVSKKNAVITTQASAKEEPVTALTTIDRIKNADGSYTAKFTTDWYVPAGQKVQSVKTYYRLTNTTQTQNTLVAKNQSVTSKLTNNAGTFIANISVKAQYGKTYKVYAVSCVTLDNGYQVWSEVVVNNPAN